MLKPLNILIARTCAFQIENHQIGTWLFECGLMLGRSQAEGSIGEPWCGVDIRARIHHSRNYLAQFALDRNIDYLLFVDGDMQPDFRLKRQLTSGAESGDARSWARPFLTSTLEFMQTHKVGVVGAPAVSGPPENKLNVFIVDPHERDENGQRRTVRRMRHDEYKQTKPQFMPVAGVGTGLMMIDTQVLRKIPKPWFEDEEEDDKTETIKSQDMVFCFKCNENEIPVYANFFSPARHVKFQGQDPPDYEGEPCQEPKSSDNPIPSAFTPVPLLPPPALWSPDGRVLSPSFPPA